MTGLSRRQFSAGAGAALAAVAGPRLVRAEAKPPVVVIGGGVGGATAARYLAREGLDVTLIEAKERYVTCFFSDLYLAGLRTLDSLTHGYDRLAENDGIKVIHAIATGIDPVSKIVELNTGAKLAYERLVMSPGIAFKFGEIEGYDEAATAIMPHAWTAGPQTELLRRKLEAMQDGGTFVIVIPPDPFRCPPGPYERASLAAYYFKQYKPKSKVLVLDAKDAFKAQELFEEAWARRYPGMIEWLPAQFTGGVKAVDVKGGIVVAANTRFPAVVANVIPAQMAGHPAEATGLTDKSGCCPVDPVTFASTLQPDIHVIGDAIVGGDMPKSAFSANTQAKTCAFAIAAALNGAPPAAAHLFNSCYTFLGPEDAFTNAINFKPADGKLKMTDFFISKVNATTEERRRMAVEAVRWYGAFMRDVFG
jgi:NADPH-dependent 2,4-dienoyl-CoA reductase/sulfur reductase-like enzyme